MAGSTQEERRVPPYVALIRIGAVLGMSFFAAGGILLLIGDAYWQGLVALALATPFFGVMRIAERLAERNQGSKSLQ
ncbi:MAG: hypothetical protein IIB22_04905 [Chloroflexi bacterium]|nr:hypothetical protein [Chloroflexota bacterium]